MAGSQISLKLIFDTKDVEKGASRTQKSMSGLGVGLKAFGALTVAQIGKKALAAIKDFAMESIQAFSELEQASGATQAIFGGQANQIERWARQTSGSIGLAESDAKNSANIIGSLLQNFGFSADFAAEKSMELTELGADLAAMFGGQVPEAVDALSSALKGQFNPMEKFGVTLTAARIEAKALEMGLAETKGEIDANAKATATLALITEQSSKARGAFAREADTIAGKEAILNAQLKDAKALFGESLAPAKQYFQGLQLWGVGVLTDLAQWFGHWTGEMDAAKSAAIDLQQAIKKGKDPIKAVGDEIHNRLPDWEVYTNWLKRASEGHESMTGRVREAETGLKGLFAEADALGIPLEKVWAYLEGLAFQGVITREELEYLKDEFADWNEETKQQEQDLGLLTGAVDNYRGAGKKTYGIQDDLNESWEEAVERLKVYKDELNRTEDAVSGLFDANKALKEAEDAYQEAVKKFGPNSEEAQEAALGLWEARNQAQIAWGEFFEDFPDGFEQAFQTMVDSGMAPDTARALIDEMQAKFNAMPIDVRLAIPTWKLPKEVTPGMPVQPKRDKQIILHGGGVVPGIPGQEVPALLEAGETVLPTQDPSFKNKVSRGQGVAPVVINLSVNALDPSSAANAVVQALQEWMRRNGAVPIDVRTN